MVKSFKNNFSKETVYHKSYLSYYPANIFYKILNSNLLIFYQDGNMTLSVMEDQNEKVIKLS